MHTLLLAAASTHVVVENWPQATGTDAGLFGWREPIWVGISAVVSAAVAIVTYLMARYTKSLAVETSAMVRASKAEALQDERHHRQSLSPIVVADLHVKIVHNGARAYIEVEGNLRNIGTGPAVRSQLLLRPMGVRAIPLIEGGAIGQNAAVHIAKRRFEVATLMNDGPTPFYCATKFIDLFGNDGWTIQRSSTGDWSDFTLEVQPPMDRSGDSDQRLRTFEEATAQFYTDKDWLIEQTEPFIVDGMER